MYTWGHVKDGRLGNGLTERRGASEKDKFFFPVPSHLKTLETIYEISCGVDHTLAAGGSGVWAWGNGSGGKLGLVEKDTTNRLEPCLVPKLRGKSILQVVASTWHR